MCLGNTPIEDKIKTTFWLSNISKIIMSTKIPFKPYASVFVCTGLLPAVQSGMNNNVWFPSRNPSWIWHLSSRIVWALSSFFPSALVCVPVLCNTKAKWPHLCRQKGSDVIAKCHSELPVFLSVSCKTSRSCMCMLKRDAHVIIKSNGSQCH